MRHAVHASPCIVLFFILTFGPSLSEAGQQQPSGRVLTLEEALELAESRSEQMTIAAAGVDRAAGEQTRARSDFFPQLSGSVSYDRALASEFSDFLEGDPTGCPPFAANPSASIGERVAELERAVDCGAAGNPAGGVFGDFEDLPFGQKNTYRFALTFSQNLFSGGRIAAQTAIANASRRAAEINLASTRAQLLLEVVRTYFDAALSERLLAIAQATYEQADATFRQTQLAYKTGSQPEFELLRAQVGRDNLRPAIIRSRAERDIALLRLKQLLDIPGAERVRLVAPLEGDALPPPARFAESVTLVADTAEVPDMDRAPIRQAEAAVRQREAAVDAARALRFPTVSVTSSFGQIAYPSGAFPAADDFRRNWTVGAIVQVPILNGGRLRADQAIAQAETRAAAAQLQHTRELALLDTQSAYAELRAAGAQWEASAGTVEQAQRAYEIAELRYREGVSTQLELSDARLLLAQAQVTRAQAGRDLQVARARVALLPDLPLEAGGSPTLRHTTAREVPQTPQQQQPAQTPPVIRATTVPGGAM